MRFPIFVRLAPALALALAMVGFGPAFADQTKPDTDPFHVTEKVDATAASSSEAYTQAVNQGRAKAWDALVKRLVPEDGWSKVPTLDDTTLQRMVRGYNIANERRSTTRYVADVTYVFNDNLVRRFFRANDVAYTSNAAPPLLLVPMAPGYAPDSAWAKAWEGNRMAAGVVPIVLPAADPLNKQVLGPIEFDSAGWNDVQPAASRARAAQVALAQVTAPQDGQMTVNVKLLSSSLPQTLPPVQVPVTAGEQPQALYAAAVQATGAAINEAWKMRNSIDFSRTATLSADVAIDSLQAWGNLRQRLAKVPVVTNVKVAAMAIGQARIDISYAGTQAQLGDFLSQASLALTSRDGVWWLAPGAAAQSGGMDDR